MNRFIKYNKYYRLAILCSAIAIIPIIWAIIATIAFANSPIATISLFFVPVAVAVAVILAINFWYEGEDRRIGLRRAQ
jgi:flagellar biosynthesis protein FliQ